MSDEATPRYRMPGRPGSHVAYVRGEDLVVEWYDFGDQAPYESANLLVLDPACQRELAVAMGLVAGQAPQALAAVVAHAFHDWFEFRRFAQAQGLAVQAETDFMP